MSVGFPSPTVQDDVAFIGVFHGEGIDRLERLYRSVRPWFPSLVIALQGPTPGELEVTKAYADVVIEHPTMGYCEWSFNDVYAAVRETGLGWTFNLDGDELADAELLSGLASAARAEHVIAAGGARFARRNVFVDWSGRLVPGFTEETIRLLTAEAVREPVLHGHSRGTKSRPPLLPFGSIWQFRTNEEFVADHARYLRIAREKGDGASLGITKEYLVAWYQAMRSVYTDDEMLRYLPLDVLSAIDETLHPETTWT